MPTLTPRLRKTSLPGSGKETTRPNAISSNKNAQVSSPLKLFSERRIVTAPVSFDTVSCSRCGRTGRHVLMEGCGTEADKRKEPNDRRFQTDFHAVPSSSSASSFKVDDKTLPDPVCVNGPQKPAGLKSELSRKQHQNTSTAFNNCDLEDELRRASESKARLEAEVKEGTELLQQLRGMRVKVVAEGEKLRKSAPIEQLRKGMPFVKNAHGFFSGASPVTEHSSSFNSSPKLSEARIACMEAYARMTPTQRFLWKEQYHQNGAKRRGLKEKDRQNASTPRPSYSHVESPRSTPGCCYERNGQQKGADAEEKARALSEESVRQRNKEQHSALWKLYENSWDEIWSTRSTSDNKININRIPWPITSVFATIPASAAGTIDEDVLDVIFSTEHITSFLFSAHHSDEKTKRRRLHEALLRYHPDRFEQRVLCLVAEKERAVAKQVAIRITGVLNSLLQDS